MSQPEPDLTDPLVWDLLQRNHVPEEQVVHRVDGKPAYSSIVCELDREPWPCPTRVKLDDTHQPTHYGHRR